MKTIKQLLVAVALLLCCVTANAYDFEVDGIYYSITSTSYLTVDVAPSPLNSYQGNIVIPKYVTYDSKTYTVTGIENEAFYGNKYIYSVVMPQSITDIGMCAFWGCSNLNKITVSENIVRIGVGAFHQTAWFNNKSAGVVYIGKVLYGYKGTMPANTSITVKEGTIGIAEGAFMNNKNLKSITFPNSLIIIGGDAFLGTTWYNNQPNGAIYAGKVFYGYKSSTASISVNIKDGTLGIADCAFNSCSSILSSVTIPNSVTYIGEGAFNNCNLLTSITIPDKVTTIEAGTFQNCSNITSVTISANVAKIKKSAFLGCTKLTSVNISNLSVWLKIDFQSDYSNPLYYAKKLYLNGSLVTDLIVPDSFKQINAYSFRNCTSLKSILIPNSITNIETSAFEGCTELKTVINCSDLPLMPGIIGYGNVSTYADWVRTVPQGVIEGDFIFGIKNGEYQLCIYIGNDKSLTLPYKYKEGNYAIGDIAFAYCKNIESIIIPDCVTSIEDEAFKGCSGLTSIEIPNSVTSIGDGAFYNCYRLTSIEIPNGVTSIGDYAFYYCSSLTSIEIPNGVTSIGDEAFYNCYRLTSVTIPNSVTSIGDSAFASCSGLTSVTIPNSVTSIGNGAFSNCSGLTSVTIGNSVTTIGNSAFSNCSGLTSVTIPNSVTSIGYSAFSDCPGLKKIEFKCAKIGTWFNGLSIEEVEIDYRVTSIAGRAFKDCSSLTNIHLLGETPPSVESNTFAESQYATLTIYVPQGSLSTYQSSDVWKNFWDIREESTTETPEEEVKKCATPVITYSNSGLDITSETDDAKIHTNITCNDVGSYNGSRIDLSETYSITTYATKSGYLNSDTATATLCWIAVSGSSEENSIIEVEAMPVLITCDNGTIIICGGEDGAEVVVYTTSGVAVGNATITNGNASISTGLTKGETAIINIAGKGIKVVMQ